ncbi:hypothetical protein KPY62_06605 [Psychrobacter sp. TAE2020]|uniref:hypothetical protein n=1 Tax=Psychrobacter sp. TAE2020 TaxID=2846762 RepID=UPI001C10086E|nr:hypothetical protein [Psychrobacter sp. TAE2020]MBU5616767.1 hypothetical protein [Psychrobacter sp. TAE2020]
MITSLPIAKKLLMTALAVAALTLSACADKEAATGEADITADAQTAIEQEATGVSDVEQGTKAVNSTVTVDDPSVNGSASAEADDNKATVDELGTEDGIEGNTIDDSEVLEGSETQEHVSTY